jgi:nifR3 family TIM-barrel protein
MAEPNFTFAGISVRGRLILAPMDGYSSWPFRSLCRDLGSSLSYTEFVRTGDVLQRPEYLEDKLFFRDEERPVLIQIYGNDPQDMLEAALRLQEREPDAIDINLGCPTSSIAGRGAGVGLMRTPLLTARIFRTLAGQLSVPVTAKIRLGWEDCRKYLLIARIIEENGGQLLAVHARTKEERHHGPPDLEALAEIKDTLTIPVIGNGGIQTPADIREMLRTSGCDGVMIGRGAVRNPWIFSWKDRAEISPDQVLEVIRDHLGRSLAFHGPERGVILFRKHAARYLEPYQLPASRRRHLLTRTDPEKFLNLVEETLRQVPDSPPSSSNSPD